MSVVVVTGSSGLIGSETARFLHEKGLDVVGIDNNFRKYFFGPDGSTEWNTEALKSSLKRFTHFSMDIRDQVAIDESMSIDQSKHSLFGASKIAADVLVQEYGRYFDMKTGVFRAAVSPVPPIRERNCTGSCPTL